MSTTRFDAEGLIRVDEDDCWEFLAHHQVGRIAVNLYNRPSLYPVNYAIDGESIVFRTGRGSKLTAADHRELVAFGVDDIDEEYRTGTSVLVHGLLTEITDEAEREAASRLSIDTWAPGERSHLVRVRAQWVTGRRLPSTVEARSMSCQVPLYPACTA